jgi:flagellar biosynthesis chaperone FliJ
MVSMKEMSERYISQLEDTVSQMRQTLTEAENHLEECKFSLIEYIEKGGCKNSCNTEGGE